MNKLLLLNWIAWSITSARALFDEPKEYAPVRLVEAVARGIELLESNNIVIDDECRMILDKLDCIRFDSMMDDDELKKEFDNLIDMLVNAVNDTE